MREKFIKGYNKAYKINERGEIFSRYGYKRGGLGENWYKLKWVLDKHTGYYLVTLVHPETKKKKNHFIHRLIAEHFIPNPENKPHVNHIDGDKTNNNISNLEWVTPKENSQHAVRTGLTKPSGEKPVIQIDPNHNFIIGFYKSIHQASRETGIAWQNISKVVRKERNFAGNYYWEYA